MKKRLSEAMIEALRPQAKRYIVMDSVAAGLGVRVSTSGRKTFVMVARFSGKHPTTRSLGKITLEEARDKAQAWRKQLVRGVDPKRPDASSSVSSGVTDSTQSWRSSRGSGHSEGPLLGMASRSASDAVDGSSTGT